MGKYIAGFLIEIMEKDVKACDDELKTVKEEWSAEQSKYREKISEADPDAWDGNFLYLGGVDISFIVGDDVTACACYVVINNNLEIVYQATKMVEMTAPYIPGFLATTGGRVLGAALKTSRESCNPVYVSVGSGLSLTSAVELVNKVAKYRIPEPTRQADIISREFLRINHPTERQKQPQKNKKNKA